MRYNTWISLTVLLIFLISAAAIGVTIWNDPLFQYSTPYQERYREYKDATYQNPGMAKNAAYDTIVTGSSVTQNFDVTYFNDLMDVNSIKLSYSGANSWNLTSIIQTALSLHFTMII